MLKLIQHNSSIAYVVQSSVKSMTSSLTKPECLGKLYMSIVTDHALSQLLTEFQSVFKKPTQLLPQNLECH